MKSKQTMTYGSVAPVDTQDTIALRNQINKAYDTPDASIPYSSARQREAVGNRFGGMYGANYSPEVQDAIRYSATNDIDQEQGAAVRLDSFNRRQAKTAALGGLAQQTGSRVVQTGGSGTGTQTQGIPWGRIISAAGQAAGAAI